MFNLTRVHSIECHINFSIKNFLRFVQKGILYILHVDEIILVVAHTLYDVVIYKKKIKFSRYINSDE